MNMVLRNLRIPEYACRLECVRLLKLRNAMQCSMQELAAAV